ncbi:hypothetical protein ABQE48_22820 [Mycolicibacterium thermoresistibile]
MLNPLSPDGVPLEASFELLATTMYKLTFHHKAGRRGSPSSVNADYNAGLELLLTRLAHLGMQIDSIVVDSAVARKRPLEERRLDLPYPIKLSPQTDIRALRLSISRAQKPIARRPDVKPTSDGNSQKTIVLSLTGAACLSSNELAQFLATGEKRS